MDVNLQAAAHASYPKKAADVLMLPVFYTKFPA